MTLRTKLASFHARIHSHRHNHFHLSRHEKHLTDPSPSSPSRSHRRSLSRSKSRSRSKLKHKKSKDSPSRKSFSSTSTSSSLCQPPVLTLLLPTPSHDAKIEARVYHPPEFPADYGTTLPSRRKAAIVAHPYASLGGSWDDPVVLLLVQLLTSRGYIVATFNFGGAGNSKGKTSWTGAAEKEEYATVAAFLIKYASCIDPHTFTPSGSGSGTPRPGTATKKVPMKVLLAGYSYGSLIASRTPTATRLIAGANKDILAYATRTAYEWASTEKRRSFAMTRNPGNPWAVYSSTEDLSSDGAKPAAAVAADKDRGREKLVLNFIPEGLETNYLFISPLLPPVSLFLTLPNINPTSWWSASSKKHHSDEGETPDFAEVEDEGLVDTLAVYGTTDMFTGVARYRNWAKAKVEKGAGRYSVVEIDGAGHFWGQEMEWMERLRESVGGWADRVDEGGKEEVVVGVGGV